MPATILPKRNSTASSVPPASSLTIGELAVNTADGRIYIKNSANSVINLAVSSIAGQAISPSSVSTTGDINAATGAGFKINNTAASGSYLRGDGTRFVSNTIQSGDLGTGTANSSAYLRGDRTWQTLNASAVGLGNVSNTAQVTAVTGTAPIVSSGGTTPAISISAATTSAAGSMSAADKLKLDGIAANANNYSLPATVFRNDATNAGDLRFAAADGRGMRFWDSDDYKIWMSASTNATWGGRLDSTSDYNMYFRINQGTNRGFVFRTASGSVFQIEQSGSLRTAGTALTASAGFGLVATGNNVITATTNAVERLRITGAGDVGIGVSNPNAPLTTISNEFVQTTNNLGSTNRGAINIRNTTSARTTGITFSQAGVDNAQAGLYCHQNSAFGTILHLATTNNFTTGPQVRLTVRETGDVAINPTGTQVGALDIQRVGSTAPTLALRADVFDVSDLGSIVFYNNTDNTGEGAAGAVVQLQASTGSGPDVGVLNFYLADFNGSAQTLCLIKNKVGINTTDPACTLDVGTGDVFARGYLEKTSSPAISSGTLTLNLNNSRIFLVSLNANITTLTISNVPSISSSAVSFTLILTADGTARSVTWPGSVKWAGGTAPTLTSTNAKKDVLSFLSTDNGTTWLGFVGGLTY